MADFEAAVHASLAADIPTDKASNKMAQFINICYCDVRAELICVSADFTRGNGSFSSGEKGLMDCLASNASDDGV